MTQHELLSAIDACLTVDQLSRLKQTLPVAIVQSDFFRQQGLRRYGEITSPAPAKTPAPEPYTDILDRHGRPIDVGRYIAQANSVELVNATLRWLRQDSSQNTRVYDVWLQAMHEKAITGLGLTYDSRTQYYYQYNPQTATTPV